MADRIVSHNAVRRPFIDPSSGVERELVVLLGAPRHEALLVEHDCSDLADVSPHLDAWFCTICHARGRISGAWAYDVYEEVQPKPVDRTCVVEVGHPADGDDIATWRDERTGMAVCDRHRSQYDTSEHGPFSWVAL